MASLFPGQGWEVRTVRHFQDQLTAALEKFTNELCIDLARTRFTGGAKYNVFPCALAVQGSHSPFNPRQLLEARRVGVD